jgi:iron complex transport system substrate-binding protein
MRIRNMGMISMLVVVMILLAACGQNNAVNSSGNATEAPTATGTAEPAAEERTITTINGEVTIPANPQRIVATYYIGELAALGIKPVGSVTRQLGENNPNLAAYTEGVAEIGDFPPSLEAITALAPDLIIATDFDSIDYADYAKIAPTVVVPWTDENVYERLQTLAAIFGKEAEAEAFIKQSEAKAAEAREKIKGHISPDETVAVFKVSGKALRIHGGRDIGHALYNGLQLTPPPSIQKEMEQNPNFNSTQDISLEDIPSYAADRIFIVVPSGDDDSEIFYKELEQLSIWKDLPAVKNNKIYLIPSDVWFTYDPISINVTLDEAVKLLTAEQSQ